jgi:hypothetical protein
MNARATHHQSVRAHCGDQPEETIMNNDDNPNPDVAGRATLTLAAGVAALGMRSNA